MTHVALRHLDHVRDQVVAPFELDLDLREGVLVAILQRDQLVEGPDQRRAEDDGEEDQTGQDDDGQNAHDHMVSQPEGVLRLHRQPRVLLPEVGASFADLLHPALAEDEEDVVPRLERPAHPALKA